MVVPIPDPVGLAADLNGIRTSRDRRDKEALLALDVAWPLMTNQLFSGLKGCFEGTAMAGTRAIADGSTSKKRQDEVKNTAYYREGGYTWSRTT